MLCGRRKKHERDPKKLVQHRDDILRAEIAGWLHNLGKLEPNFEHNYQVIRQSNELQDTLDVYHIPGQIFISTIY